MFKKIMVLGAVILLGSCTNSEAAKVPNQISIIQSSIDGSNTIIVAVDNENGCKYVRSYGESTFTYLHGSCTNIIKQENGVK